MDPYDRKKTQEIWKRVLADETPRELEAFDSAKLQTLICQTRAASGTYRLLVQRNGCYGAALQQLARQSAQQSRTLASVYFLWTGQRPAMDGGVFPQAGSFLETLRALHREETERSACYRCAAQQLPEHSRTFQALSDEALCAAKRLQALLAQAL